MFSDDGTGITVVPIIGAAVCSNRQRPTLSISNLAGDHTKFWRCDDNAIDQQRSVPTPARRAKCFPERNYPRDTRTHKACHHY